MVGQLFEVFSFEIMALALNAALPMHRVFWNESDKLTKRESGRL